MKAQTMIIVGSGGSGSVAANMVLIELVIEQGYHVVVDDVKNVFEPEPEVFLITTNHIPDLPEEIYLKKDYHPFSKFIGKHNWKR